MLQPLNVERINLADHFACNINNVVHVHFHNPLKTESL